MTSTTPIPAAPTPVRLAIGGMSCGHCIAAVERAIAAVPGARVGQVALGSASVELEPGTPAESVVAAVREAGYMARLADAAPTDGGTA